MHQIFSYIRFLWHSTNEHGVHSPFVYSLLTECLYKKESKPAHTKILEFRKALLKDEREIDVTDFGAGSRVFKSNTRKVSAIAKNAGISKKRAILLNKLTSYLEIKNALELGTSVGLSSAAIAMGNNVKLTTIEGCPETAKVAAEYFKKFGLENIQLEVGSFEDMAPRPPKGEVREVQISNFKQTSLNNQFESVNEEQQTTNDKQQKTENGKQRTKIFETNSKFQIPNSKQPFPNQFESVNEEPQTTNDKQQKTENGKLKTNNIQPITDNLQPITDLVYFDGNHQKEATLEYFYQLLPLAHNASVFIFDDIHWSKGMEEAWEEIKSHPKVRVTIDSFFWGLVFFRREQEKEHFIIRL